MMNLKLVTFIPDGTQFLVDTEFNETAFEYALEANLKLREQELNQLLTLTLKNTL